MPGGWELVAILAVLVLLFGATKLPMAARSIGQSMRIFKAETKGLRGDDAPPATTPQPRVAPTDPQALPVAEPPRPHVERAPGSTDTPR